MASTAAWSAAFSSPRPTSAQAAMAAASDTRTASMTSERSSTSLSIRTFILHLLIRVASERALKPARAASRAGGAIRSARADMRWTASAMRRFGRGMGGHDDRHAAARPEPGVAGSCRSRRRCSARVSVTRAITPGSSLHDQADVDRRPWSRRPDASAGRSSRGRRLEHRAARAGHHVGDIGGDRRGGRPTAGARPGEEDPPDAPALDEQGVERTGRLGERMAERRQGRLHARPRPPPPPAWPRRSA